MAQWPEWDAREVVEHGVPDVPDEPIPGHAEVPVALWVRDGLAAVLFIYFDPDDEAEPFSQDIELLERTPLGGWRTGSRGGSDWPLAFGERPRTGRPALTGFAMGLRVPGHERGVWIASGIAPAGISAVVVKTPGAEDVVSVEPTTGAFLACIGESFSEVELGAQATEP